MLSIKKLALTSLTVATLATTAGVGLSTASTCIESPTIAYAETDANVAHDASRSELNSALQDEVNTKKYAVEGGGTITGAQLVNKGDIISTNYDKLTGSAKQKLVTDMVKVAKTEAKKTDDKVQRGESPSEGAISDQTVSDWISDIQSNPGVGSKMMTQVMADVKPDYTKAGYILQPFKSPLNTAIAIVVILVMLLLALTFAVDLAYLYVPLFNETVNNNGTNRERGSITLKPSSWVSRDAKQAYEETEQGGTSGVAYFKKRVVGCLLLGLCIMFLAQGQIFTIVGWIMDLVSGILHLT